LRIERPSRPQREILALPSDAAMVLGLSTIR
jgi:hypothetical protein